MLKKKIGAEAIEKGWPDSNEWLSDYFKILSTLIIPESCERIGIYAFWCCEKIKVVYIPKNIKSIGRNAFGRCSNLKNIVCEKKVVTIIESSCSFGFDNFESIKVSVISEAAMKNVLCFMQKVNTLTNRKV